MNARHALIQRTFILTMPREGRHQQQEDKFHRSTTNRSFPRNMKELDHGKGKGSQCGHLRVKSSAGRLAASLACPWRSQPSRQWNMHSSDILPVTHRISTLAAPYALGNDGGS
jgi:hypothetical protein